MIEARRANWVDTAKGIGILLVVYGHVARGVYAAHLPIDEHTFRVVDDVLYSFHMPLFFFLSGLFFLKSWNQRGTRAFVSSKLATLVYPYVIWSLLQGFLEIILSRYTNKHATLSQVLSLLWHPRQQFWFLYALFFVCLLFAVIYHLRPAQRPLVVLGLSLLAYVMSPFVPNIGPFFYLAGFSVFFALGILLSRDARPFEPSTRLIGPAWVLFAFLHFVVQRYGAFPQASASALLSLLIAVLGIAGTCGLSRLLDRNGDRLFAYLGRRSLPIYLMHTIAASGVRIVLQKFGHIDLVPVHLIVGTLAGVLGPLVVLHVIERFRIRGLFTPPTHASSHA